jgi:hypothetical protein
VAEAVTIQQRARQLPRGPFAFTAHDGGDIGLVVEDFAPV